VCGKCEGATSEQKNRPKTINKEIGGAWLTIRRVFEVKQNKPQQAKKTNGFGV